MTSKRIRSISLSRGLPAVRDALHLLRELVLLLKALLFLGLWCPWNDHVLI
jgi:hypothetical protein